MSVRWKWVGLWAVVVAAEIAALAAVLQAEEPVPGYRVVFRLIGAVFCACGLVAGVIGTRWVRASPPRRRAIQDRVEALNGHLLATSPPGEGTVVVAELPCGS
jgi:hypothetical protein